MLGITCAKRCWLMRLWANYVARSVGQKMRYVYQVIWWYLDAAGTAVSFPDVIRESTEQPLAVRIPPTERGRSPVQM